MKPDDLLAAAQAASDRGGLERHREAILVLRDKGYTWRQISEFLAERGIRADHTKIYRLINKGEGFTVPNAETYKAALSRMSISESQRHMLRAHYCAPNRTITYTQLARAAGYDDHQVANRFYGQLGRDLGEEMGFQFADSNSRAGEKFYSSSIGVPNTYTKGEFELMMHHELAKAIDGLGWFEAGK